MNLWNRHVLPSDTASHPRRLKSSATPLWESQISRQSHCDCRLWKCTLMTTMWKCCQRLISSASLWMATWQPHRKATHLAMLFSSKWTTTLERCSWCVLRKAYKNAYQFHLVSLSTCKWLNQPLNAIPSNLLLKSFMKTLCLHSSFGYNWTAVTITF